MVERTNPLKRHIYKNSLQTRQTAAHLEGMNENDELDARIEFPDVPIPPDTRLYKNILLALQAPCLDLPVDFTASPEMLMRNSGNNFAMIPQKGNRAR